MAPWGARAQIVECEKRGIDLFAAYRRHGAEKNVRVSLAYLLLLDEDRAYLEYASHHTGLLVRNHEFRVWTYLLWDDKSGLTPAYEDALIEGLKDVNTPDARITVASRWAKARRELEAVEAVLGVLVKGEGLAVEHSGWKSRAYGVLRSIAEPRRSELLPPYLETESVRGAHVAYVLAATDEHRERAIAYLKGLTGSSVPEIATIAEDRLKSLDALNRDPE
jgi:hypothetical protein